MIKKMICRIDNDKKLVVENKKQIVNNFRKLNKYRF